jgi:predicted NAD/FAD-dependent oxidoreductase
VGISIHLNTAIASTLRTKDQWQLIDDLQKVHGPYDALIVAVPPPRARELVEYEFAVVRSLVRCRR